MRAACSYFGNRILKHVRADMARLVDEGFTTVVHTFNENDLLFYRQGMAEIVAASKEVGLQVHLDPWGVGKVFGGESFSNFVATNLDCLQVLNDGRPGGAACPMQPAFREFMRGWIDAAVDCGADCLFWDEPHFMQPGWLGGRPEAYGCFCPTCRELFRERTGGVMPSAVTPEVAEHLEWAIVDFLNHVIGYGRSRGVRNALCIIPYQAGRVAPQEHFDRYAAIEGLNVFGADPYFSWFNLQPDTAGETTERVMESCRRWDREEMVWFQAFKIPAGEEPHQADAVRLSWKAGARSFALWGFDACRHITWIRPGDPDALWRTYLDVFTELKDAEATKPVKGRDS